MTELTKLFGNNPDFVRCPYSAYARMRAGAALQLEPSTGVYVIPRYEEQHAVLADPVTFSSRSMAGPRAVQRLADRLRPGQLTYLNLLASLNTMDGLAHLQLRGLVAKAFNRSTVRALEPFIETRCDQLLDQIHRGEPVDFVKEFAAPLAVDVIAEVLGVRGVDHGFFRWYVQCVTELTSGRAVAGALLDDYLRGMAEFTTFFRRMFERLRERPDGGPLAWLVNSGVDGRTLTDDELLGLCLTFVVAGTESTRNLLASAVLRLANDPGLVEVCRMCPAAIPIAVEEFIRLDSPFQGFFRTATVPARVGGVPVPAGAHVLLLFGSANRDEAIFKDPDELSLGRRQVHGHLGFGHGKHQCLGADLARAEARIAVGAVTRRFSRISLCDDPAAIPYGDQLISRGPTALNVRFNGRVWRARRQ